MKAVTLGVTVGFLAKYFALDDITISQHDHPMDWTNELDASRAPTHALGYRQVGQAFSDE